MNHIQYYIYTVYNLLTIHWGLVRLFTNYPHKLKRNIGVSSITGWWLGHPSSKMMEFVSWGYAIPNILKNKIHVPNHQPDYQSS